MVSKIFLGIGIFAAVFAVLIFSGKITIGQTKVVQGSVILWGTIPESQMGSIIQDFNAKAKTYDVTYKEVSEDAFNQRLLEALASGYGPDLIMAPYQTILSQASRLYPIPATPAQGLDVSLSEKEFKDLFIDGASPLFFTKYGAIAVPVSVEPMVLFYNRTLLSKHGIINPPETWDDVTNIVPVLTITNNNGQFLESGIALGAPNTPYAKDILMAIVSQLGQVPVLKQYDGKNTPYLTMTANQPVDTGGDIFPLSSAVRLFAQFADPVLSTYSWNEYAGSADDLFVAEKLAMYIGYSGELEKLRARNPRAEIEISRFPQVKDPLKRYSTAMRMYGIATLKTTRNLNTALVVQTQFSGANVSPGLSTAVGGVPALRAYAASPDLSSVIKEGMLVARGWQDSFPKQSTTYTSAMISDVLNNRQTISDAANIFVSRLQDLYTPMK